MNLFQWGDFKLSGGRRSPFKIDCDRLSPLDWRTLSDVALSFLPPFSMVEGVPMGGLILAGFLSGFAAPEGKLLIVDDVLTTGASMERQRAGRDAIGLVVFARSQPAAWITPLFLMSHDL